MPSPLSRLSNIAMLGAVVLACGLSACGGSKDKAASQVAAKVNDEEISVHQINFALQRSRGVTSETAEAASRQILERLIIEELAVQKSRELKLDRSPTVVQALEAARRDVLARAYLDTLGESVSKPTPQEVADFYAKKPALFKERKVYTFQEVSISGTPVQISEVQSRLAASKSAQEFADYLKGSGLRYGGTLVTQPAENLPMETLDRFAAMNPGQAVFFPQAGGAKAVFLVSAKADSVAPPAAAPAIEKFLLNDRKRVATESQLKSLRAGANVQLVGKFAESKASGAASNSPLPPAPASSSTGNELSTEDIKKGLSGLK